MYTAYRVELKPSGSSETYRGNDQNNMSKSYKLTYFDARGRGEFIRLIFNSKNIKFEDNRVKQPDWPALKPKTPMGHLPVLQVGNVTLSESITVARFAANEAGIAGKTILEKAQADMIVESLTELITAVFNAALSAGRPDKVPAALAAVIAKEGKTSLGNVEKCFVANNPGGSFLVGKEMTWADICIFNVMNCLSGFGQDAEKILNENSPKLLSIYKCVAENPNIANWVKTRPETPF
ncbi:unnamed protein product [Owenia fusiformis]|uniref:Uncharacterized protein n=1 Tax=Owenia fusiformis TaxID=6347 RepID=A0A8J1YC86_OWEFU|nr:unnamed protein product [Owenia fusiformis]